MVRDVMYEEKDHRNTRGLLLNQVVVNRGAVRGSRDPGELQGQFVAVQITYLEITWRGRRS